MAEKNRENLRRQSLNCSIKDGTAYAIMDGSGNSYITPFAVALNASTRYIGIIASLPNLVASLLQLNTVRIMERSSRKKLIVKSTLFQALMWLPIALLALFHSSTSLVLLMIFYTILVSTNAFIVPAWNSWMKDLVDKCSGKFFGNRSRINGIAGLIAMLAIGYMLDIFKKRNIVFVGFFIIFLVAFFARIVSRYYLSRQYEPKFKLPKRYYFSFFDFVKRMGSNNFGKFSIYVALFNFAVYVASPFFTVYMLRDLKFSYSIFTLLTVAQSVATFATLPLWGRFADKYGNLKSIKISGLLIPLIPFLWIFSTNIYYLLAVQIFSGVIWASFNLSASNFIYDAVSRERMGLCVAYSGLLNTFGVFIGSSIGGFLTTIIRGINPIIALFLVSSVLRLLVSLVMLPRIREVKEVKKFSMINRLMMLMPMQSHHLFSQNFNHHKK